MRRLCSLLLSVLWSAQVLAQPGVTAQPLILALNWKAEPQFGGFYAAQVADYYRQNNLNVKIIEGGSGTPTIQMLLAGKVDYAIVSADEVLIAHARGASNLVALFATFQINPQGIMTHAARGFKSIEEVVRSDGVLLWQSGLPYAQYIKKRYAPLTVTVAPYIGGIGNFQNDPKVAQQCFVTSEPLTAAAAGLQVKTFLIADTGYNPYTSVLVTSRERWQTSPAEVKSVVDAVRSGWNNYLEDPAETNAAMRALNKAMSPQTFAQSAQAQQALIKTPATRRVGEMTQERWQTLADQLLEINVIQQPVSVSDLFVSF